MVSIKVKLGIQGKTTIRMTIPMEIRKKLGWKEGDTICVDVEDQKLVAFKQE